MDIRRGSPVKIMVAPNRYIQGAGVTRDIGKYISYLGSKVFIIGSKTAFSVIKERCEGGEFEGKVIQSSKENRRDEDKYLHYSWQQEDWN